MNPTASLPRILYLVYGLVCQSLLVCGNFYLVSQNPYQLAITLCNALGLLRESCHWLFLYCLVRRTSVLMKCTSVKGRDIGDQIQVEHGFKETNLFPHLSSYMHKYLCYLATHKYHANACGEQTATCRRWFFPSTILVLETLNYYVVASTLTYAAISSAP